MYQFNSHDKAPHSNLNNNSEFLECLETTQGLKEHYQQFIEPHIEAFEKNRLEKLEILNTRKFYGILAMCVMIPLFMMFVIQTPDISHERMCSLIALVAVVAMGLYIWKILPSYKYKQTVKQTIFPLIFKFFGKDFSYKPVCHVQVSSFKESNIIPDYDIEHTEDYIIGTYKGVGLRLLEATLIKESDLCDSRKNSYGGIGLTFKELKFLIILLQFSNILFQMIKNYFFKNSSSDGNIVFQGIILTLDMNKNFSQKTIIKKDAGAVGNWFTSKFKGLENVKLEDPIFEKQFEVYSSSQTEARYLLTTSFMERLLEVSNNFNSNGIECSFYDNKILMMIPSKKDRFEAKSIFEPVTFIDEINEIIDEMKIIFQIIDTLKLNQKTGL